MRLLSFNDPCEQKQLDKKAFAEAMNISGQSLSATSPTSRRALRLLS
jgi:hypothetical protein